MSKKITKKNYKNNFVAIFTIALFIGSMIYFVPERPLTDLSVENKIAAEDTFTDLKPVDSVIESPMKSVIDYDTWYLGESIKTDIEFNKQTFDISDFERTITYESQLDYVYYFGLSYLYADDSYNFEYRNYFKTYPTSTVYVNYYTKVYCGGSGTFYAEGQTYVEDSSSVTDSTTMDSCQISITSPMLDAEGYLHLEMTSIAFIGLEVVFNLKYRNVQAGSLVEVITDSSYTWTGTNLALITTKLNYLYFTRDTITNNVRSEYKYNSPTTMTFAVSPPSVAFAKEQNIYYDNSKWTYSSITPYASVTDSSGVLTINSPTELDYEVLFTSKCSNHLAIKDVSTDYFDSVGFEEGTYQNDFSEQSGYDWDSMSISTEKFYEGYYSLELENTVASRSIISIDAFEGRIRNFYFQISVYYETVTSGSLYIYYSSDTGWTSIPLDNTIIGRWQTVQIFVADAEFNGVKGYFRIDTLSGTNFEGKVFIDNMKILETSTTIKTLGSSEAQIDFDGVVADGYKFAQDSFRDYQVEIWDRTAQTLEYSYSVTTDEFGHGTVTHLCGLEQKEHEIKVYSEDSYFLNPSDLIGSYASAFETTTGWSRKSHGDSETISLSSDSQAGDYSIKLEGQMNPYLRFFKNFAEEFDLNLFDYVVFDYKSNATDIYDNDNRPLFALTSLAGSDTSTYRLTYANVYEMGDSFPLSVDTWYNLKYDVFKGTTEGGSWDSTSVDGFYFTVQDAGNGWCDQYIDDLHFIHATKLYFTPSYADEIDYALSELSDAWDFSEGDDESWLCHDYISTTLKDGYFSKISNTVYSKYYIENIAGFDENKYVTIVIGIWSNVSQTISVRQTTGGLFGTNRGESYYALVADVWRTIEVAVVSAYDIDCIRINSDNNANWKEMRLDLVKIIYTEAPELYETDTSFYLSSTNNTNRYEIYLDENYLGVYTDLQTILKNNTVGDHNLTYVLFSDSAERAYLLSTYEYLYTVEISSLTILVWNKDLDLAAGLIFVNVLTSWANQSIRVSDNTTWLGNYQDEGTSIWTFTVDYGFHNITIGLFNGTTLIFEEVFSFTIVEPTQPEGLIIYVWNKDLDLAAGLISVNILTSWGNQSIRVSDNGTWLGNYAIEGTSIWTFTVDYGFHNISIYLYNGVEEMFVECFSFTIQEPTITIWAVHFDIITTTGVGLPFETCKIIVNDSRIYSNEKYYLDGVYLEIQAFDFYDNLLYETTRTITNNVDISLVVPFNLQTFENPYEVFVRMTLYDSHRDGSANQTWDINPHSSLTLFMMSSSYNVLVTPLDTEVNNGTHIIYYTATLREYVDLAYKENVYTITVDSWAEELEGQEEILEKQLKQAQLVVLWETVFLAMMLAVISMLIKWGAIKCINFVLIPFMRILRILFGLQPKILVRDAGGLRFISLDQWEKYQTQQEKGVV